MSIYINIYIKISYISKYLHILDIYGRSSEFNKFLNQGISNLSIS